MRPNKGSCPRDAKGKRIRGVLRCGRRFGFEPASNAAPAGWAAETTRWTLEEHPYDVTEFEVIG